MKRFICFACAILFTAAFSISPIFAGGQEDSTITVQALAKELEGQQKWLRIDVVKIHYTVGGKDATHVDPDGKVYYRANVGHMPSTSSDVKTTSKEEFAVEARRRGETGEVRVWHVGRKVKIHEVKLGKDQVQTGITDEGGTKTVIKFKFEKKNYTVEDFKKALSVAFANSESEIAAKIELGMSIDEVIKVKGNPKTRADLGAKVILTYDDLKITFQEGKLVDVQ